MNAYRLELKQAKTNHTKDNHFMLDAQKARETKGNKSGAEYSKMRAVED